VNLLEWDNVIILIKKVRFTCIILNIILILYVQNVDMDQSWINSPCISAAYERVVEEFIHFA